jgi:hypothetical protein
MVDEVALGQSFLRVHRFPLPVLFHQYSILVFIYTLMLSEGKGAEPGNLPKRNYLAKIGAY